MLLVLELSHAENRARRRISAQRSEPAEAIYCSGLREQGLSFWSMPRRTNVPTVLTAEITCMDPARIGQDGTPAAVAKTRGPSRLQGA